ADIRGGAGGRVARGAQPAPRLPGIKAVAEAGQPPPPAGLGEAVGVDAHPGEAGEGLERDAAEGEAIADLAEHLGGGTVAAGAGIVGEARKDDGARGVDVVPGKGGAATQAPGAEAGAGIARDVERVDVGRAQARRNA